MSLANQLATSLERNDEQPNIELAKKLSEQSELNSEILELLSIVNNAPKALAHDAIKVLYELAALRPEAFGNKLEFVFDLLDTKNNRVLWGALTLLSAVYNYNADRIADHLPQILLAADRGSVIAKDATFAILLGLTSREAHQELVRPELLNFFKAAAPNQLPMYAENAAKALTNHDNADIVHVLFARIEEMPTSPKRQRLEKAIAALSLPPKPLALL